MFKPNPKAQVELKFRELFGRNVKPVVTGHRDPGGVYTTTLGIKSSEASGPVATARHRDWRKAYKLLVLEVEKLYADGRVFT